MSSIPAIVRPTIPGASVRAIVSTSGSSGMRLFYQIQEGVRPFFLLHAKKGEKSRQTPFRPQLDFAP